MDANARRGLAGAAVGDEGSRQRASGYSGAGGTSVYTAAFCGGYDHGHEWRNSLLFILLALCSSDVAMMIIPLTLLRNDMMERWKLVNIGCVAWDSWRPAE
jgi:hypothetical protein